MRVFSSTLLCALLFACGSKSTTVQDTAEPPADQESQESHEEDPKLLKTQSQSQHGLSRQIDHLCESQRSVAGHQNLPQ